MVLRDSLAQHDASPTWSALSGEVPVGKNYTIVGPVTISDNLNVVGNMTVFNLLNVTSTVNVTGNLIAR
jgi:UDP-3-O-[3-hydroxymyristoyl] glucosamine N-acyltransferase